MSVAEQVQDRDRLEPVLRLTDIHKHYGTVTALNGVNMTVMPGEVVGLVGDNGAGKSTLVKTVAGTISADEGSIEFDGVERHWESPQEALRMGIETLYQDGGLAPQLSVSANVFLGRELRRSGMLGRLGLIDKPAMRRRAFDELRRVGIGSVSQDVPVSSLSGGQRQGVAIGRTVAWARRLIILDEPTNHLSVKASEEVLRIINEVRGHGVSVIFISHTIPHVMRVTDRIVCLRLGQVVSDRPTSELTMEDVVRDITGVTSVA